MSRLKRKMATVIPLYRERVQRLRAEYGDVPLGQSTVASSYGGMRGLMSLVCDTSNVPPDKGLLIRGIPIRELADKLPEEIMWLLLTGEKPTRADLQDLQSDLKLRQDVPSYVWDVLRSMPSHSHPMAMLNAAILVMQAESEFAKAYNRGIAKSDYWIYTLEDMLNLIARLPGVAAGVYRIRYKDGVLISPDPELDWGSNYAHMLGLPDPDGKLKSLLKTYMVLHSDHESGNVSAFATATVSSALSDLYYSVSAGLNGLAGPLHGLANQECLKWVLETMDKFGGTPTKKDLEQYTQETLDSGRVIPGYGHAVLRVTDPRFTAFLEWGKKNISTDPVFKTVSLLYDTVPGVLKKIQKIQNPWPNVDAGSGCLLYHFGLKQFEYYTVLFSVSRAIGVCSQAVLARGEGLPITRPKSVTTDQIEKMAKEFAKSNGKGKKENLSKV